MVSDAGADDAPKSCAKASSEAAAAGVATIDLLQFHWWSFEHPAYLDAMERLDALRREGLIRCLGVTNFDTAHLRLLVKHGIPIASNQVSFSLLDRRAAGEMSAFCLAQRRAPARLWHARRRADSRTLARPPRTRRGEIADWSKMKYKRFVAAIGGWARCRRSSPRSMRSRASIGVADRRCRDALGARPTGGRRGDRRRAARRTDIARQSCAVLVSPR